MPFQIIAVMFAAKWYGVGESHPWLWQGLCARKPAEAPMIGGQIWAWSHQAEYEGAR